MGVGWLPINIPKKYKFKLLGVDANPDAIKYARELSKDYSELSFETIDIFSEGHC